jgi:hypothetical protein
MTEQSARLSLCLQQISSIGPTSEDESFWAFGVSRPIFGG